LGVNRPVCYNKPNRRQALLEIRRLIVDEGLSHNEIQLRLNLSPSTYFRYLDILFKAEQEAISGNNYTYQRLLNETLILNQRYLHRARKLTEIGDDEKVDVEQRIEAHKFAAQLERAVHDMSYIGPSYLRVQGLLPNPKDGSSHPALAMSQIDTDDIKKKDPFERHRMEAAGEYRRQRQLQGREGRGEEEPPYDELDSDDEEEPSHVAEDATAPNTTRRTTLTPKQ
jgi:hypothetical protein